MGGKLKWSAAQPIRPRHQIVSSDYVRNNQKPFVPNYEKDCEPINMFALLSNDYQKQWVAQKKEHHRVIQMEENSNEVHQLQRRFLPRQKPPPPEDFLKIIKLKQFENVPHKVVTRWQPGELKRDA